jgi:hypothetical protein
MEPGWILPLLARQEQHREIPRESDRTPTAELWAELTKCCAQERESRATKLRATNWDRKRVNSRTAVLSTKKDFKLLTHAQICEQGITRTVFPPRLRWWIEAKPCCGENQTDRKRFQRKWRLQKSRPGRWTCRGTSHRYEEQIERADKATKQKRWLQTRRRQRPKLETKSDLAAAYSRAKPWPLPDSNG